MNLSWPRAGTISHNTRRIQHTKTAIAVCLVAAAAYAWWPHRIPLSRTNILPASQSFISPQFQARTEQARMTEQIGKDILETVAYAVTGKRPKDIGLKFQSGSTFDGKQLRLSGGCSVIPETQVAVSVEDYFWSPSTFAPWARALLTSNQFGAPKKSAPLDREFVERLTNPMPETLTREDRRLSEALTKEPLNPEWHEQAALLIGSFAMRQSAAAGFCDLRRHLCKMTSHLALAKAIRGSLGPCGELAEALLCTLCGRETPALGIADQLQHDANLPNGLPSNVVTSWQRGLRLHNTGDYRILDQPDTATLLEKLEYFRALRYSVGTAAASQFLATHDVERLPEWSERILAGDLTVEDGNRWATPALEMELEACAARYRNYFGRPLAPDDVISALNISWEQFPTSQVGQLRVNVLGWGAWAEQHQRQLCELIETTSYWLGDLLGVPDSAAEFENKITAQFEGLNLFPLIRFYTHDDNASIKAFYERVRRVAAEHRDWITFDRLLDAQSQMLRMSRPAPVVPNPHVIAAPRRSAKHKPPPATARPSPADSLLSSRAFFMPLMPVGTLYDVSHRLERGGGLSNVEEAEAAKALAPSNRTVLRQHLMATTRFRPTPEQTEAEFGQLRDYDVAAMKTVADAFRSDPARYVVAYAAVCRLDPDRYLDLGKYLLTHNDESGAAQAYQNGFDHATDRVSVSNCIDWLVNYYYDHGRRDDALRIATDAADVYSQQGLVTLANLLDRMGQLDQAEAWLKKAEQRYPKSTKDDLLEFYTRNREKSTAYAAAEKEFRSAVFPSGIEYVGLADFHQPPSDGVILTGISERTAKAQLQQGDIFVGLNGYRIHNVKQYNAARHPNSNPNVTFILWRGGKYVELKTIFPKQPDTSRIESYPIGSGSD
jgi:tetratricopeptide (TPR) repeat protein